MNQHRNHDAADCAGERRPLLPYRLSRRCGVALDWQQAGYRLFCRHDASLEALQEAQRQHGQPLACEWLSQQAFEARLGELHDAERDTTESLMQGLSDEVDLDSLLHELPRTEDLLESESEAPVIRLINGVFSEALRLGASDIHVEPFEKELNVRLRVDGTLRVALRPPRVLAPMLISRIKVMAQLDIAEKRQPQDGRISVRLGGRGVDIRVSTLPGIHGERVVMRLLDKQAALLDLNGIGMPPAVLGSFRRLLARPNGILLNTGPTGSGKTTTLYASLAHLNDSRRSILTVEDPVEYALPGIGQTPVNPQAGLTFAHGLRAILRQDPDIIMIGEIRDLETAAIAVQASLTGHLVLSTLHTNSALGAVTRLRDMGIEPYLLASSLKGVMAQRLVRRLCADCRGWRPPAVGEAESIAGLGALPRVAEAVGCERCEGAGYRGRLGVYEFIDIDETLAGMIHDRATESEMARHAFGERASLASASLALLASGETSPAEILRAIHQ
ncbi:ATPase, T2SS/T4P/T4SS family [Halomonas sp. SSL-5]|uniref:GspE/PulE family protein n=1 Tax=Halomonas sp. SSL-5 TaxID=3065855 RepID=UPI0027384F15|nr:ATPase, T2SS/T4P/T4SS family [Halomonas sp. SSL-5]MDY7117017.1 ATPase, T2SS/T4P/T4SS family [Halomonas sp. SSL-5]